MESQIKESIYLNCKYNVKTFLENYTDLFKINDCINLIVDYLTYDEVEKLDYLSNEYECKLLWELNETYSDYDYYTDQEHNDSIYSIDDNDYFSEDDGLPLIPPDFNERLEQLCEEYEYFDF